MEHRRSLTRYAWLSITAALITMGLKVIAYLLTRSVGLLSDALESAVNLGAGLLALTTLSIGARPPDEDHAYGHAKAEYFSSGAEGALIMIAAAGIVYAAVPRLLAPRPLQQLELGLAISVVASLVNLGVARVLARAGRRHKSVALEADAQHLLTDVWTSAGVLLGIAAVALTGWEILDPLLGLAVAGLVTWSGLRLVRRSTLGLMDTALPPEEMQSIETVLASFQNLGVRYHALRTRQAGARSFVSVHLQVPGRWTVQRGHNLLEEIEDRIRSAIPYATVFTHIEPVEDPASWKDETLDRSEG
jgi:cation diffusion facilitator family transporter